MKKTLVFTLFCALLVSCTVRLKTPEQADADRGAQRYPGLTLDNLAKGQLLYKENCSTCHKLKKPSAGGADYWAKWVPKMSGKANKKAGKTVVDQASQDLILRYLVTMGKK